MSSTISIHIKGFDEATGVLRNASNSVRGLSTELKKASSAAGMFKNAMSVAAGVLLRDVVRGLGQTISESAVLGGQLGTLQASFDSLTLSVGAASLNLEGLRRATNNTVSDIQLLTAANTALMLKIPTNDLGKLMQAAIKLGHAMGIPAARAVDRLSIGLGRQSKLVMDDLGVVFEASDAYNWYAKQLGVTSNQLTDSQKKLGWQKYAIELVMEKARDLGDVISETQLAQEQWNASIENTKTGLGGLMGPLGKFSGIIEGLSPAIGLAAAPALSSLITKIGGSLLALPLPIKVAGVAIAGLGLAWTTNFLGMRDALTGLTKNVHTNFREQTAVIKSAHQQQLDSINNLVAQAQNKYAQLENALDASYTGQLNAAQQSWLDIISVTTSGWDNIVKEYQSHYDKQVADTNTFYDEKLAAEREYLDATREARSEDIDALELQFLKEKQAIEESDTAYANKKLFIERLEKKFNEERIRLSEDYRVKELEAEQQFNDAQAALEDKRTADIQSIEEKRLADIAAIRAEEKTIEEQHAKDLAELETQKQAELQQVNEEAYRARLDAEQQFNVKMVAHRAQMYDAMKQLASGQGFAMPSTLGEESYPLLPVIPGQHGFSGLVRKPTLFLAGEAGTEHVSITPRGGGGGGRHVMGQPVRVQNVFNAPLIYVEGSADEDVVTQAVTMVHQTLQNIVIEASSASAPAEHKRIRVGGTTPTTVPPSTTTLAPGGGGAGSPFRKWI